MFSLPVTEMDVTLLVDWKGVKTNIYLFAVFYIGNTATFLSHFLLLCAVSKKCLPSQFYKGCNDSSVISKFPSGLLLHHVDKWISSQPKIHILEGFVFTCSLQLLSLFITHMHIHSFWVYRHLCHFGSNTTPLACNLMFQFRLK